MQQSDYTFSLQGAFLSLLEKLGERTDERPLTGIEVVLAADICSPSRLKNIKAGQAIHLEDWIRLFDALGTVDSFVSVAQVSRYTRLMMTKYKDGSAMVMNQSDAEEALACL